MNITHEIKYCEVCGNQDLESVLNLGSHPLCDDLVPMENNRVCEEFPIEILFCSKCLTAHQRYQVKKEFLFPRSYHYRARFTADVLNGMSDLVDNCEKRLGSLEGKVVLDIGCNDASLLDFFKQRGAVTLGIEPTDAYMDGQNKGHKLFCDFFTLEKAKEIRQQYGSPDVITFTNVFAHIDNLPQLLQALQTLIGSNTMLVIENHYLGAVINRYQFDTFYHEHPRTYSLSSFQQIAQNLKLPITGVEFSARYGGNIRVFIGGETAITPEDNARIIQVTIDEASFFQNLRQLQSKITIWQSTMRQRIDELVSQHGKLPAKAFPGRAAILIKLLNLDHSIIDAVYEKPGSMKIGHYVPGTRIPIKSDDVFFALHKKPEAVLNLAWHIGAEIKKYFIKMNYSGEIVDILDPQRFQH